MEDTKGIVCAVSSTTAKNQLWEEFNMSKHLVQIELTEEQWATLKSVHKSGHKAVMHAVDTYIDSLRASSVPVVASRDIPPLEDLAALIEETESAIGHPYTGNPALRTGWWTYVITEGCIAARRRWESEGL